MRRKLDLSGLTDDEAEHVLQVVQRDFTLRKKEEDRLNEIKQKLDEEGNKCSILSRQQRFNEHCCMRCCSPFTFLINAKRQCQDCKYNICKNCSSYEGEEKTWLCNVCQQARFLRAQSLEWYYNNVKSRFKRSGSAKVLKNLYRKHRLETGTCSDILEEGRNFERIIENEGSICGSDSNFYKQTEGHSMIDTLAVALRVAEEVIEETFGKAETCNDSLEKQYEACYFEDHKEELIEELATTIAQKIIRKHTIKTAEVEADSDRPTFKSSGGLIPAIFSELGMLIFPRSHRGSYTLWRSQSACSLTNEDTSARSPVSTTSMQELVKKQKEHKLSTLLSWKSVDQLNKPNGNFVATQSVILPCPQVLAKPKSQEFKALENESNIISVYDEMGSDGEDNNDWNVALNRLQQKPKRLSNDVEAQPNAEWNHSNELYQSVTSPSPRPFTNGTAYSDSETSVGSSREPWASSLWAIQKRTCNNKDSEDKAQLHEELDVNFNPQGTSLIAGYNYYSDSSENEEAYHDFEKRSRRWEKGNSFSEDLCRSKNCTKCPTKNLHITQVSDLSEADVRCEEQHQETKSDPVEEKLKARLLGQSTKMKDSRKISSVEQPSESRTESENQKSSLVSEDNNECIQEELKKKSFAVSLCNISTEVLKVINATEELIAESTRPCDFQAEAHERWNGKFPLGTDPVRLDGQLSMLEENVYLAAGSVYGLENQLNELEDAARKISSITSEVELADMEDQVATAAAQVHHTELQISGIESRITALSIAGLNVAPCVHLTRRRDQRTNQVHTIDTSRQQRRKLPAPPMKDENMDVSPVTHVGTVNRNFILQESLTQRTKKEASTAKDLMEPTMGSSLMY